MKYDFIFLIIGIIIWVYFSLPNEYEHMADVSATDPIKQAVKQLYLADVEAIRNLSNIATQLQKDGLTVPGKLAVKNVLEVSNPNGTTTIGSQTKDWANFTTDRPAYLFDKPIALTSNKISGADKLDIAGSSNSTKTIQVTSDGLLKANKINLNDDKVENQDEGPTKSYIVSDNSTHKKLMIIGSKLGSSDARQVGILDDVSVGRNLTVNGASSLVNTNIHGKLTIDNVDYGEIDAGLMGLWNDWCGINVMCPAGYYMAGVRKQGGGCGTQFNVICRKFPWA
jgi:hypothetical protein